MPREPNPNAGQSTELVFPDGLEGTVFRVESTLMYPAEEVREETGNEVPEFGDWVKAQIHTGEDWNMGWIVGLSEVEQWLANEAETNKTYELTRAEKTGVSQTDPYEVNIETVSEEDQQRFNRP